MIHGQEREEQRRRDYQRSELMSLGEQLRSMEAKLNDAARRLVRLERELTKQHASVQAGANDLSEG